MQLSTKEWKQQPTGTKGILIKTFNGNNGNLVGRDYVLRTDDDEMHDDVQDCKEVSYGYFTETYNVTRG